MVIVIISQIFTQIHKPEKMCVLLLQKNTNDYFEPNVV